MRTMLSCFTAGAVFAAMPLFMATPATADPYKWCAVYSAGFTDGGKNCGFITIEQCRATVSGIGGYCERNPFYTGPERKRTNKRSGR